MLLLSACQAWAVDIHGKAISTIPDILKEARTSRITDREGANLELPKHSIMRLHEGKLDLNYNIGSNDSEISRGCNFGLSTLGLGIVLMTLIFKRKN